MDNFKGGRGKKAPYETVMYRIPVPVKPVVEMLAYSYRLLVDGILDPKGENLIKRVTDTIVEASYPSEDHPVTNFHNTNNQELKELRLQLERMKKIESDTRDQILQLRSEKLKAATILREALNLKANAGGKIKDQIREALKLIDEK